MNKKSVLLTILGLIFLAAFNCAFFLVGSTARETSAWIAYGFIHFAYVMLLITPCMIRKSTRSDIFAYTLCSISTVHFILQLVVGILFMLMNTDVFRAALLTHIILTAVYSFVLVTNLLANEHTADHIQHQEAESAYIKTAASRVYRLMNKLDSTKANKEIEKAYDLLHSSPIKSTPSVSIIEKDIIHQISRLEDAVSSRNDMTTIIVARELIAMAEERNRVLKLA